jgi:histidinol-phosphate aminotransferase
MSNRAVLAPNLAQLSAYKAPPPSQAIKLDAMENPYTLPDDLKGAWLARMADVTFNRYPDAAAVKLKAALEARFAMPADWALMLGNGSDEIIQTLCLGVARPDAVVMAPEPSFVMYRHLALACNLRFVGVPLQDDFCMDLPAFLAAMEEHQPALVFLAQPNNPTGNVRGGTGSGGDRRGLYRFCRWRLQRIGRRV